MKKLINFALVVLFSGAQLLSAQGIIPLNAPVNSFKILSQTKSGLRVSMSFSEIKTRTVSTSQGPFTEISVDGFSKIYNSGKPQLPALTRLLEIPYGASVSVNLISYDEQIVPLSGKNSQGFKLMPCQPTVSKNVQSSSVPFYYDQLFYMQNAYNTDPLVTVNPEGITRGVQMGTLSVSPIRYNPAKNILKVYNNLIFEITFNNADYTLTEQMKSKYYSPAFTPVYNSMINYTAPASKDQLTKYPIKYVIVSLSSMQTTLQPFVKWKRQKGFTVIEQYYASLPTTATVKTYLQGLYTAGTASDPAPSFVLFVGDVAQIPTYTGVASTAHKTDLYYVTFDGSSDYIPDMYYGRFSATSTTQLQPQIDKTLEYEKYLMPNPSYLDTVIMIAGVDDGSQPDGGYSQVHANGQINYGTTNYFNTAHGIYSNTYLWPTTNSSSTDVLIRNKAGIGVGYANYTAHGSSTGWADPSFQTSDVASMHNNHKYGLMIGNCCQTNTFNDTECFGEALLRAANKGAVGYIGASDYSYWDEDYYFGVGNRASIVEFPTYDASNLGAYDRMFHDQGQPKTSWYYTNGQMIYAGNLAVEASASTMKKYYWEVYHLMGDPSVMTYFSVPDPLTVSYVNPQNVGVTTLTVNTEEDAYVAISHNGVLLDAELAPVGGVVTLNFTAFASPDTADIVVTKQNKQPYIGTVRFVSPSLPRDASISNVIVPAASYSCAGISITPQVTLTNMGTSALTSVDILYHVDAQSNSTYHWTGNLATLASVDVNLPSMTLVAGSHSFTAATSNPNNGADQNTSNDSYTKNYTVDNLVVSADFSAATTSYCTAPASVSFTNASANGQTWNWDFGDGSTSTDQNPTHSYTNPGVYTVVLTAGAGVCGSDAETKTSYITVGSTPPSTIGAGRCGAGSVTLTASGSGTLNWYDAATGGNLVNTGTSYITPSLSSTTTYYVVNSAAAATQNVGKTDITGGGGNSTLTGRWLVFDCYAPCTLVSAKVYASTTGNRTFELRNSAGTPITETTVNITTANTLVTVPLNFAIPVGTDMQIGLKSTSANSNLYRNTGGVSYPYTYPGYISITTSNAGTNPESYYYYLYDWVVQPQACTSAATPVTASIFAAAPVANFTYTNASYTVNFNNTSTNGSSYYWDFGDGTTSTQQTPSHTYSSNLVYNVMLITTNNCTSDTAYASVNLTTVSVSELANGGSVQVYPNPVKGTVNLVITNAIAEKVELVDVTGRILKTFTNVNDRISVDMQAFSAGVYYFRVISGGESHVCKFTNLY
jgi:PKD repeat protein